MSWCVDLLVLCPIVTLGCHIPWAHSYHAPKLNTSGVLFRYLMKNVSRFRVSCFCSITTFFLQSMSLFSQWWPGHNILWLYFVSSSRISCFCSVTTFFLQSASNPLTVMPCSPRTLILASVHSFICFSTFLMIYFAKFKLLKKSSQLFRTASLFKKIFCIRTSNVCESWACLPRCTSGPRMTTSWSHFFPLTFTKVLKIKLRLTSMHSFWISCHVNKETFYLL